MKGEIPAVEHSYAVRDVVSERVAHTKGDMSANDSSPWPEPPGTRVRAPTSAAWWLTFLRDHSMAVSLLDRLLHHPVPVVTEGGSFILARECEYRLISTANSSGS